MRQYLFPILFALFVLPGSVKEVCAHNQSITEPVCQNYINRDSLPNGFLFTSRSFFWNREFFNKITQGFTYPGFWAEPVFVFGNSLNINIEAGINVHQYFGDRKDTRVVPVFSVSRRFAISGTRDISFRLGRLPFSGNNRPGFSDSDPIYRFERLLTNPV